MATKYSMPQTSIPFNAPSPVGQRTILIKKTKVSNAPIRRSTDKLSSTDRILTKLRAGEKQVQELEAENAAAEARLKQLRAQVAANTSSPTKNGARWSNGGKGKLKFTVEDVVRARSTAVLCLLPFKSLGETEKLANRKFN